MPNDLRLNVRLTADGRGFRGEIRLADLELDRLAGATRGARRETDRYNRAAHTARVETGGFAARMQVLRNAARYAGPALAGVGVAQFVRQVIEAGVALEGWESRLRAATGSAEEAADELQFLRNESERLGLNFAATADAYTRFTAAARGTVLEGQLQREIFSSVAEAGRVMNLTAEEMRGTFTALEQIISKGNVSAEELRGQLGERLPGAYQIAARAMNVTTAELDAMLRRGEVLAEELLPLLARELRATVADELPEAVRNAAASFERMGNAWREFTESVANSGALDAFARMAEDATTIVRVLPGGTHPERTLGPADVEFIQRINPAEFNREVHLALQQVEDSADGVEAQLEIARIAIERFGDDIRPGEAGFAHVQRAREFIERYTGLTSENIALTFADKRAELESAIENLDSNLAALRRNRGRQVIGADGEPFNLRTARRERERIEELRAEVAALERRAGLAIEEVEVNAERRRERGPPGLAEIEVEARRREVRGGRLTTDHIQLEDVEAAEEQRLDAIRQVRERKAQEAAAERVRQIRAQREQELLEAQGYRSREEAAEDAHQRALLALRTRYAGFEFQRILQSQHQAQQQLEAGNQRAVQQIVLGQLQSTLGALGRYNRRAFRLAQAAGIAKAVIDTQQAITEALKQPPPLNFIYAGLATAQGAAAIATIRAQRPPQAFRLGGVVDRPTFFEARNLSRGGVAGEAGPEGILPLRRGRDGRLGVEAHGGAARPVVFSPRFEIQVTVPEGTDADQAGRVAEQVRRSGYQLMRDVIAEERRPGGLLNPTDTV